MDYIGIMYCFRCCFSEELLAYPNNMAVCRLHKTSLCWLVVDDSRGKIVVCPLNGFLGCFFEFLRCKLLPLS